jgi:hypothetical protein
MAKIGEGSFKAAGRQGLRELRAALYPESNVAQPAEYGMYGTKTPGEIADDRRDEPGRADEEGPVRSDSVLASRLKQGAPRAPDEERGRDLERD